MQDPEEFRQAASFDCSVRFKAAYCKPLVTINDKDDIVRCISLHYSLVSSLSEANQFTDGLKLNGFVA